ncbi:hypothetical protein FLA4_00520 [Candidatus Rickettsia kotlanii]|nr:hypothetical protein FLA4_00520 [Candidatus Rickettsia kotlanii]BDU60884.1 hypothetical protein HM2_00520 [Candidatus Rickettsia kotlanii]
MQFLHLPKNVTKVAAPRATVNTKLAYTPTNATAGKCLRTPTDSIKYNFAPTLAPMDDIPCTTIRHIVTIQALAHLLGYK